MTAGASFMPAFAADRAPSTKPAPRMLDQLLALLRAGAPDGAGTVSAEEEEEDAAAAGVFTLADRLSIAEGDEDAAALTLAARATSGGSAEEEAMESVVPLATSVIAASAEENPAPLTPPARTMGE